LQGHVEFKFGVIEYVENVKMSIIILIIFKTNLLLIITCMQLHLNCAIC